MSIKGPLAPLEEKNLDLTVVELKIQTAKRITIEGKNKNAVKF